MNNVLAPRNSLLAITSISEEAATAPRRSALALLLREAASEDGDVLYPLLAMLLETHLDYGHDDGHGNTRIRDSLDNVELLLALDIERMGLRRSHAPTVHAQLALRAGCVKRSARRADGQP